MAQLGDSSVPDGTDGGHCASCSADQCAGLSASPWCDALARMAGGWIPLACELESVHVAVRHGSNRVVRLHTCWLRAAPLSIPANQVEACVAFYHLVSDGVPSAISYSLKQSEAHPDSGGGDAGPTSQ